jgi:septal ring factor EnvC (AmiA/AmiB activator)
MENIVLEHLRAIRSDIGAMKDDLRQLTTRMGHVEIGVAGLRRDIAHSEQFVAESSVRYDQLRERIERIEKRLEII